MNNGFKEVNMDEKSVIIIGAGITGLSAGCYGQMNGYNTQIFEMHNLPGGVCTSWKRKDYIFDGCIHWLIGTNPKSGFHPIWKELGALQDREIVNHEVFQVMEDKDGKVLNVYTDIDRFETHLLELSPEDSIPIKEYADAVRKFTLISTMPVVPPEGILGKFKSMASLLRLLPFMRLARKYSKITVGEYAQRYKDPFLRFAMVGNSQDFPIIFEMLTMAWLHMKDAGYPVGGSLEFSRAIENRYSGLGGKINYKSRVEKILVEDDRAIGVRLTDGSEHHADYIISAADGYATIFEMLEGKYIDDEIRNYYEEFELFEPLVVVSLGVDRDFCGVPHSCFCQLIDPITFAEESYDYIPIKHYCFDPTMAPAGKSAFVMLFPTKYDYWKDLYADRDKYTAEKNSIAEQVIDRLEKRWPGFAERVEVIDVATPVTWERFTGNWQASFEGWMLNKQTIRYSFGKGLKKTLPGLDNFYMIGQWTQPGGGLPPAATMGRDIIRRLCKLDRKKFQIK
jgi:phytoene dehydrogenase-like protein